jgi:hypothetical protein
VTGISQGGYLTRWQLENRPDLYDGGVDWEGTFWNASAPNVFTNLAAALKYYPTYRATRDRAAHDAMIRAGFAEPVMDVERCTLTYADAHALMRDLKAIGAHNVNAGRPRGLTGKSRLTRMIAAYEAFRREGRLPATYEIVYGQAWAAGPARTGESPRDGEILAAARAGIEALNARHAPETTARFFLFHRTRQWNERAGLWMGWERKRGKIEEFNRLLRGATDTSFTVSVGDLSILPEIR